MAQAEGFASQNPPKSRLGPHAAMKTLKTGHADAEVVPIYRHREHGLAH